MDGSFGMFEKLYQSRRAEAIKVDTPVVEPRRSMPKYIFAEGEYANFVKKEYVDLVLTEPTGRKYNQLKVRYYSLPGAIDAKRKYGYSSGLWMGANSFAPGGIYESHLHKTPQWYYVLEGKAKVRVGDEERVVGKGSWVFTPPGIQHSLKNIGKKPFTYLVMGGNPQYGDWKSPQVSLAQLKGK